MTSVLEVLDNRLTTSDGSFTISFYIRIASDVSSGGVFEFNDSQFRGNPLEIEYSNHSIIVMANGNLVGKYHVLQRKSTWTFLAFTFDAQSSELAIFSEHGLIYSPSVEPSISASNHFNNGGFRLGYGGMNIDDAVSCFAFYSINLNWPQIKQLQEACRIVHGSPLAGTPKLPLTPIPSISNPPLTTVPQEGQFPWLGILERVDDGSLACTISILDEFWVLTTANCFDPKSDNDSTYQVKVGVHDISLPNGNTQTHEIAKVVKSGSTEQDIALVQLKTPVDFTSDYVNDAYLFDGDASMIELHQPQFVSGWGINGRNSFISKTLPRYVPGNILSDTHCSYSSNQTFNPSLEYCFLSSTTDKNVPCSGDEGSPLMFQGIGNEEMGIGDRLVQVGLYFNRNDLCTKVSPAIFLDIHYFQDWITEQMACALPGSNHEPEKCPQ